MLTCPGNCRVVVLNGPTDERYAVIVNDALYSEMRMIFGLETEKGIVQKLLEGNGEVGDLNKSSFYAKMVGKLAD